MKNDYSSNNKQHEFLRVLDTDCAKKLKIWFENNNIVVTNRECENIVTNKDSLIIRAFYINKLVN